MAGFLDFLWNGKPPPSVTSNVNSSTNVPDWFQEYQKGILAKGQAVAAEPFQTFPGPRLAGFTANQNTAFGNVAANQGNWQPALTQAQGYTNASAQPFNQAEFDTFMSPYISGVVNRIGELGGRNLTENLLPGVNDTFTGAGQFGSRRHGEFTNRAVRDVNESVLGQQALALQQGQDSAMGAYNAAQGRKLSAGNQLGALAQAQQGMGLQDAAALEAVGQTQQQQNQAGLDLAYQDFREQRDYPRTQVEWLNNILKGQTLPTSTTQTSTGPGNNFQPSGLSQLAGLYSLAKGLKRGGPVLSPKRAVHAHERSMHPGKPLTRMANGGALSRVPRRHQGALSYAR